MDKFNKMLAGFEPMVLSIFRIMTGLLLFQFGDNGCTIFVTGLDKQIALLAGQGFARVTEADTSMVCQFEGELLDLQFAPFEFGVAFNKCGIAFSELRLQCRDLRPNRLRQD